MKIEHEEDNKHLITRTISEFPEHFAASKEANCMKAKRWWDNRDNILSVEDGTRRTGKKVRTGKRSGGGKVVHHVKSLQGRGRRREEWV